MSEAKTNYVDSARDLTIEDYPIGGRARGKAIYSVETKAKFGERIARTCEKRNGGFGKPKTTTYGRECAILTCDDGRTYPATIAREYAAISIMRSDMKTNHEFVSHEREPERYDHILDLIQSAELHDRQRAAQAFIDQRVEVVVID